MGFVNLAGNILENFGIMRTISAVLLFGLLCSPAAAQVERVWLSHRTNDPGKLVVSWTTKTPGDSRVRFGTSPEYTHEAHVPGQRTLHHVEIALAERDAIYHYSVGAGEQSSPDAVFASYPTETLRVAVVADWQGRPDLSALVKDRPHLLLTAGDHIDGLWQKCGAGNKDCFTPFAALIDAYPELFRSTPFLPVLGNHDREIRPRGDKPPAEPVYDIDATAFRRFFELPDDEWKWRFDVPDFGVRLIALDFNHIGDHGTTWQSCHAYGEDSEQFAWYKKLMNEPNPGFVVTLYNERHANIRSQAKGGWHELFRQGSACITGFGHYAERAELDGLRYFNTSLQGRGAQYKDPHSKAVYGENNYLLLTFSRAGKTMTVEIKNLEGKTLDRTAIERINASRPQGR